MTVDPLTLRNDYADDMQRNAKRMGVQITRDAAERIAIDDLELVDSAQYDIDRLPNPMSIDPKVIIMPDDDPPEAEQLAQDLPGGGKLIKREVVETPDMETLANIDKEKRLKLIARMSAIMRREQVLKDGHLVAGMYHHPALAQEVALAHANWNLIKRGYLLCFDQTERDRMFFRELQDICDRSTGRLGPWWVK